MLLKIDSMKFKELGLLTLLVGLFSIYGCKTEDVGLDVNATDAIQGTLIDTTTVLTRTVLEDSVQTSGPPSLPLGYINDPETGKTFSELALALHLPTDTATLTKLRSTGIIDSAVLVMKYDTSAILTYGDTTNTNLRLNVHQMSERVGTGAVFNNKVFSYNSLPITGLTYKPRRNTNVITRKSGTAIPDTLLPQLRIPVSTAFVTTNIKSTAAANVATDNAFLNFFKGLYLRIDPTQTTGGPGGYSFFDVNTPGGIQEASATGAKRAFGSSLVVYFRSGTDTLTSVFPIGGTYPERSAASIKHDYTGTPVQAQLSATGNTFPTVYMTGLAGLRTKVQFPYLKNLYQQLGNKLVINRAELVVTPVESTVTDVFKVAPRINLYRLDIAKQRGLIPDAPLSGDTLSQQPAIYGGFYDVSKKAYRFVITAYVQKLMRGRLVDYGTYISVANPGNTTSGELQPSIFSPGRVIAGGGTNATVKMKLNIIYTKLD